MSASSDAPADDLPRAFGEYVLFDHIGRGGMADIFLARREGGLGASRRVVVKRILPALSGDPAFAAMLVSEAKLAAELHHGNVVQVFDLGRAADQLYIAMEYVEGFDLSQLLRRLSAARIPLPAEFAIFIVREALRALDYAHRAKASDGRPLGIVHRDVSPSNVLVSFEGEVKLCDFGIARALARPGAGGLPHHAADEQAIARTRVVGKSAYMSPEHARGEPIDARADVFAAGILLWELCAGRRMYKGTEAEMLALAQAGVAPPLPERGLPDEAGLRAVLGRALATDRDARFGSARELLDALEDWAIRARLMASQLRFGAFLSEHFEEELVRARRDRERAAAKIQSEPPPPLVPPRDTLEEIETPVEDREIRPLAGESSEIRPIDRRPDSLPPERRSLPIPLERRATREEDRTTTPSERPRRGHGAPSDHRPPEADVERAGVRPAQRGPRLPAPDAPPVPRSSGSAVAWVVISVVLVLAAAAGVLLSSR